MDHNSALQLLEEMDHFLYSELFHSLDAHVGGYVRIVCIVQQLAQTEKVFLQPQEVSYLTLSLLAHQQEGTLACVHLRAPKRVVIHVN
jgi:hypothetical protein